MGFIASPRYLLAFPVPDDLDENDPRHRSIMGSPNRLVTTHRTYKIIKNSFDGLFTAERSAQAFYRDFRTYQGTSEEKHFLQLRLFHLGIYQHTYLFYLFHIVNDHLQESDFLWWEFRGDDSDLFSVIHQR